MFTLTGRIERPSPAPWRAGDARVAGNEADLAAEAALAGARVYSADPQAAHKRNIDVEASLKKLGLTREQLISRTWPRGSPQHRLKRAAAHTARVGTGTADRTRKNNGISAGSTRS